MNFAMLAAATLIALGGFVGFESTIASYRAHAEAVTFEINSGERMLRSKSGIEQSAHFTDVKMHELHLFDAPREQVALTFRELSRIAQKRHVEIIALRHQHFPVSGAQRENETALGSEALEITLEGRYQPLLQTVADLSSSSLVAQTATAAFERSGDRLRASLFLSVYRLQETRVGSN
jgi:hypothetical protein